MRFVCLSLALMLSTANVSAQEAKAVAPTDAVAQKHFNAGQAHFDAGEYEDALRQFSRSYELSKRPALQFNLSLCHERLGNFAEAADTLERYLKHTEDKRAASLKLRVETLRAKATTKAAEEAKLAEEAELAEEAKLAEEAELAEQARKQDEEAGSIVPAVVAYGVGALGIGLLVAGAIIISGNTCDEDANACSVEGAGRYKRGALLADIGIGVAAAGIVVGTILLLTRKKAGSGNVSWSVDISPNTAGLHVQGAF